MAYSIINGFETSLRTFLTFATYVMCLLKSKL